MALFLIAFVALHETRLLGYSVNIMGFLVGWHYVKQGYGMLSVDSVLKRKFFSEKEKRLLLLNAYVCWLYSWLFINQVVRAKSFQGLEYYALGTPDWVRMAFLVAVIILGVMTLIMLAQRLRQGNTGFAVNGLVAYVTSIYIWLIVAQLNPLFIVVIPAFHSLQYLTVVGRFQLNVEKDRKSDGAPRRLALFYLVGLVIGLLGFWVMPILISIMMNENIKVSGFPCR